MRLAADGPWDLPIRGFSVSTVSFGQDVEFVLDGPGQIARVGLSDIAELREPDGTTLRLDPSEGGWPSLAAALYLIGDSVLEASASDDRGLQIAFVSGRRISVPLAEDVETWEVTAEEYKVIGGPACVDIIDELAL